MLTGRISSQNQFNSLAELAGVNLDGPSYAVLLFMIYDYSNFIKVYDTSMQELLKFSIVNVIEELALEVGHGYGIELQGYS